MEIYTDNVHISFTPKTKEEVMDKDKQKDKKILDKDKVIGKSKIIAILLALFLGRYGIHKFYLGRPGLGLIYLIFSRFEIVVLLSICDAIYYLLMKKENWLNEYGYKKMKNKK